MIIIFASSYYCISCFFRIIYIYISVSCVVLISHALSYIAKHIINWNTHAKITKHVHTVTQTHSETPRVSDSVAKTIVQQ
jgi:hypothetical protein